MEKSSLEGLEKLFAERYPLLSEVGWGVVPAAIDGGSDE